MINDLEIVQWDYLLDPAFQLVNTAGKPLTNGWIEVYIHGTRDKYYCASDFNGTLHPFKIPLDSLGSNIVLASPANAYDVYIYNVYGSLVMSRYNVKPGSGSGSGVIPADASYGIFGTNELPMNNTSNTGFQFTAKDIGGDDITFHEITYPYGRIDCKEGVYFYSATIEVSNTSTSNESVKFQVLAGKNPNQSVYWLDFDNTYLHKQLYTICGIANFVNEDTFRINVSPYQLTNGVKASASQVAIHKLSTVVEGEGGGGGHEYGAGWGILINNDEISVDPSIIPTIEYVDASVSAVSSTLISTIESVSGNLQDQIDNIPAQVQSDWEQDDDTEVDYIKNKPDLTVYATHDEVCAVSSVLQNEIDNIDMSEYVTHTELNSTVTAVSSVLENEIQIVSAAIPDVSDFVTHDEVSAVSSNLVEYVDNSIEEVNTTINNVSGDLVEYIDNSVSAVSGNLTQYVDNSVNTASGNLVQYIDDSITEVNETIENVSGNIINEVNETINNVSGDLVEYIDNSVGAVSGDIIEYVDNTVNNVSGVLESEIQIVSGAIPVVTGYATKVEVNTVSSTIINTIEVVSGAIQDTIESVSGILQDEIDNIPEQVNADWNAVSGKAEILNKPDLSVYATHDEVDNVSGAIVEYVDNSVTSVSSVLNDKIDTVSGAIIHYQGASGVNVDGDTISLEDPLYIEAGEHIEFSQDGDNITISADVSDIEADIQVVSAAVDAISATVVSASGIEYGQFYGNDIITTGTVQKIKGNINLVDGRIHLKKGQSYQFTVRGTYNQLTTSNDYSSISYIEASSGNAININVDKTITSPQYFELSYDIFNLAADTDYIIWFSNIDNGKVNDLFIDVHSLSGIGGQGGGTGPGTEYTPGYGIQILNNVISVSGIAPQVNSDWNAVSGVTEILNKPEEQALVAGDNIDIQVSGSNVIISSTAIGDITKAEVAEVSGTLQSEIEQVSASIPGAQIQSDWNQTDNTKKDYIKNKPDLSVYATNATVSSVSGILNTKIETVSAAMPDPQIQSDWTEDDNTRVDFIKNKPIEYDLIGGQNVSVTVSGTNVIIDSTAGGDVTETELATVSGTLHTEIQSVSSAIPVNNVIWLDYNDSNTNYTNIKNYLQDGKQVIIYEDASTRSITATLANYTSNYASITFGGYRLGNSQSDIQVITYYFSNNASYAKQRYVYSGQADWNTSATYDPSYIKNKPDLSIYATNSNLSAVSGTLQTEIETVSASIPAELTGASGVKIEDDIASLDDPIFVKAGSGIEITQDGDDIVISSTVTATPQVNADWTAVSGAAEILNKPNEYNLIAGTNVVITKEGNDVTISARGGGGGGSSYIAGTGINIDANDVISVSGVAMASAIDVVSGKLPTTEIGKFTIQNNVSGGPIEVICPTDQGFPIETVILNNTAVSGSTGSGTSSVYIVYKSPGYDDDYYSTEGAAILHIPEAVTGIANIQIVYAPNSNPYSNQGPAFTNPSYIYADSTGGRYVLDAGDYDVNVIANVVPQSTGGYGKYITLYAAGPAPDVQALLKSSFSLAVRHPELGLTVNLNRYELGNTSTITNTSGYTQANVYTDPTTKKQSVYLPSYMPSSWTANSNIAEAFEYGNSYVSPSNSNYSTKLYKAYKYTSSPRRYQFAYLTDWDYANKIMTFTAYDNSGNAIEKWTVDYTTWGSAVWTTQQLDYISDGDLELNDSNQVTAIDGHALAAGSNYTAGDFIDITNDVISVDDTSNVVAGNGINISVSGIDTVISVSGVAMASAIPEEINLIPGAGITIEVSGVSAVISSTGGGGSSYTAGNMIDISNNAISVETTAGITDIQVVNALPASPVSSVLYLIPET